MIEYYYCQKCEHEHNKQSQIGQKHIEYNYKKKLTEKDIESIIEIINRIGDNISLALKSISNLDKHLRQFNIAYFTAHMLHNKLIESEYRHTELHKNFFNEVEKFKWKKKK